MQSEKVNFTNSSCFSIDSFQALQKLNEILSRDTEYYKSSVHKLFSNTKVTTSDEPINQELYSYYSGEPDPVWKKSVNTKRSDTQSKISEFFKNCLVSSQLFGCNNEPKTQNRACLCKPVRRASKTNLEQNFQRSPQQHEKVAKDTGPVDSLEGDSTTYDEFESRLGTFGESTRSASPSNTKKSKKGKSLLRSKEKDDANKKRKNVGNKSNKNQTNIEYKPMEIAKSGQVEIHPHRNEQQVLKYDDKTAKIVVHLPIDVSQFVTEDSPGNELKLVLCDNRRNYCDCPTCGSNGKETGGKHDKNKKQKKKNKSLETDILYADEGTLIEHQKLGPEAKGRRKEEAPKEKYKKSCFNCWGIFKKKFKNEKNQTESSRNIKGNVSDEDFEIIHTKKQEKALKEFGKCCLCNKYDPECPMSGNQVDTLKLLIKMEARQNYRQINNIIKELNDQQDDLKNLRETNDRIVNNFPEIFGTVKGGGDTNTNKELYDNVKTLFGMYKDLSYKIDEIHTLSSHIVKNGGKRREDEIFSHTKSPTIEKSLEQITQSDKRSRHKSPMNKSLQDKTKSDKSSNVRSASEKDSSASERLNTSGIDSHSKPEESGTKSSFEKELDEMFRTAGTSSSHGRTVEDEVPEKLPKSETPSMRKPTCPCEVNMGLYINNGRK